MSRKFETLRKKMSETARNRSRELAATYRDQLKPSPGGTTENSPPVPLAGKPKDKRNLREALRILRKAGGEEPREGDELS